MTAKTDLVAEDPALIKLAEKIERAREQHITSGIVLGELLSKAHEHLAGKGREGKFKGWVEDECGISRQLAYNYMRIHSRFAGVTTITHFSDRAMLLLSAPSTPEEAAQEAVKRSRKGERITTPLAAEILESHSVSRETPVGCKTSVKRDVHLLPEEGGGEEPESSPAEVAVEEPEEPTIEELVDEHNKAIEAFCRAVMKVVKTERPDVEWLAHKGRWDGFDRKLKQALDTLRSAKAVVCPACEGEGCTDACMGLGYLPKIEAESAGA